MEMHDFRLTMLQNNNSILRGLVPPLLEHNRALVLI